MREPEIIHPGGKAQKQSSWLGAYFEFLRSPHENKTIKMLPLVLLGVIPASLLDDLVLPGIGLVDDLPTALLAVIVLTITYIRVRRYR